MSSSALTDGERSANVSDDVSIVDLRMTNLKAELKIPNPEVPLSLADYEVVPTLVTYNASTVVYHVLYGLKVFTSKRRVAAAIEVTMSTVFDVGHPFSEEDLEAFGFLGVLDIVHPYVREIVHSVTGRMGIPPLLLEVKAPPHSVPARVEGA
jgi:preprotein translocase subunit SecB